MDYVKAEYLEALNKNTNNVEKVKFIPPSPEGEDLGGVSKKYIEDTQRTIAELADKKITKFYASSQGKTHLPDSDKGKIQDMFLYGKSEQVQYKGKNLFDAKGLIGNKSVSNNGITFKYDSADDVFTISGTATQEAINAYLFGGYTNTNVIFTLPAGTYTFSTTSQTVVMYAYDGSVRKTYIISPSGNTYISDSDIGITALKPGNQVVGTIVNKNFKIQIEKGSTKTDYEPYVGGIPSPNPDYPQEIKAVVNPKVVVRGKNLIQARDINSTLNGITCKYNGDGTYTVNGTATADAFFIVYGNFADLYKTATSLKLVGCPNGGNAQKYFLRGYRKNGNPVNSDEYGSGITISNFKETGSNIAIIVRSGVTVNNIIFKPMLTTDTTATYADFEPYTEQAVTLPYTLYAIPVSTGGNVTIDGQQYVADYVDVERGKLVRNIGSVTVTKDSIIKETTSLSKDDIYIVKTDIEILGINNGGALMSNKLIERISANYPDGSFAICPPVNNGKAFRISIPNSIEVDTIHSYRIEAIGILAKLEEIDLTPEQIQAYKSLSTNYPVTNIEVSSEQLDGYTIFNYPISMAEGWNYVKQQLNDNRDYIYDMDLQSAEAYVNSEYAVALTELEV